MRYCFNEFVLDCHLFEFRRDGERIEMQPKVFSFLRLLADNPRRTLSKDEIFDSLWPDVVVADASLQRIASLARRAVKRDCEGEILRTIRGIGYRLDAEVEKHDAVATGAATDVRANGGAEAGEPTSRPMVPRLTQEIRFCKTVDGFNLAWAKLGTGTPLVRCLGWFSNIEMEWEWDAGRRFWEKLARRHTLVRYDGRGIGLSDQADEFTLETRLRDLEAVVDAAELERFALVGMSEGCSAAIKYAARHPERVSHLVLCGAPDSAVAPITPERREWGAAYFGVLQQAWGGNSTSFSRFLASLFLGEEATPEMLDYFDRMQRASADRETALTYAATLAHLGVGDDAANVRVPTLVLHRRDDELCPIEGGRAVAAAIPGARFMVLDGGNHWLLLDDPRADSVIEALEQFLRD
jgi:pimeloyl-ACP methyl ester carboxylesterase/DNA-binding winged helix-turn-helix (wHTH) protein